MVTHPYYILSLLGKHIPCAARGVPGYYQAGLLLITNIHIYDVVAREVAWLSLCVLGPGSTVHGANMGLSWDQHDPCGPLVGQSTLLSYHQISQKHQSLLVCITSYTIAVTLDRQYDCMAAKMSVLRRSNTRFLYPIQQVREILLQYVLSLAEKSPC